MDDVQHVQIVQYAASASSVGFGHLPVREGMKLRKLVSIYGPDGNVISKVPGEK